MTRADWLASLGAGPISAARGRDLLDAALAHAKESIDTVAAAFHGTLPPPPWPAPPELQAAIADAKRARDGVAVIADRTPAAALNAMYVDAGRRLGLRVFDEADKLTEQLATVREHPIAEAARRIGQSRAPFLFVGGGMVVLAAVAYLLLSDAAT